MKTAFRLTILIFALSSCNVAQTSLNAQKTVTISGKIYSPTMIGGGYKMAETQKTKMKQDLDKVNIKAIEEYYTNMRKAKNKADTVKYRESLKKIGYSHDYLDLNYLYAKTNQLGILFLPCVTIETNNKKRHLAGMPLSIYDSISSSGWEGKVFTFKCIYLGALVSDKTEVYQITEKL